MYSIDWARLRSVIWDKQARYGPSHLRSALHASEPPAIKQPVSQGTLDSVAFSALGSDSALASVANVLPDPESVAGRALVAIRKLFRVQGTFARIEGDHLEFLLRTHAYRDLGYSSFHDFVREELQMSSRTATRRVALSRLLRESEILSRAVDEGGLSPCQALVLEPMTGSIELSEWVQRAAGLTVRELGAALQERQASESTAVASEASGRMLIKWPARA